MTFKGTITITVIMIIIMIMIKNIIIVTSSVGSLGQPFEAGLSSFMVATGQIDWLEFELKNKEKD